MSHLEPIKPYGRIDIGDMSAAFPREVQPNFQVVDYCHMFSENILTGSNHFKFDTLHKCAYPAPLTIPYNQTVPNPFGISFTDTSVEDSDAPTIDWNLTQTLDGDGNDYYLVEPYKWFPNFTSRFDVRLKDVSTEPDAELVLYPQVRKQLLDGNESTFNDIGAASPGFTLLIDRNSWYHNKDDTKKRIEVHIPLFPATWVSQLENTTGNSPGVGIEGFDTRIKTDAEIVIRFIPYKTPEVLLQNVNYSGVDGDYRFILRASTKVDNVGNSVRESDIYNSPISIQFLGMNGLISLRISEVVNPILIPFGIPGGSDYFIPIEDEETGEVRRWIPRSESLEHTGYYAGDETEKAGVFNTLWGILQPGVFGVYGYHGGIHITTKGYTNISPVLLPLVFNADASYTAPFQQIGFIPQPDTTHFHVYLDNAISLMDDTEEIDYQTNYPYSIGNAGLPKLKIETTPEIVGTTLHQYTVTTRVDDYVPFGYLHSTRTYGFEDDTTPIKYTDFVPVLTRVASLFDGISEPPTNDYITTNIYTGDDTPVKEVVVNHSFNMDNFTIDTKASVSMDNFHGLAYLKNRLGLSRYPHLGIGNMAVSVALGNPDYLVYNPYTNSLEKTPTLWRQMVGYCGDYQFLRGAGGRSLMQWNIKSQMQQLRDRYLFAPPNFDGYNHYYVVAFLLQYAGITPEKLAFRDFIPDYPFNTTPAEFSVTQNRPYFLPVGQGMGTWTPTNRSMSVLEMLEAIRKQTQFLLFEAPDGMWHYEKWTGQNIDNPVRTFTEYGNRNTTNQATEIWNLVIRTSTADVRNNFALIGIDANAPDWQYIIKKKKDDESVHSAFPVQPINYIGFNKDLVWVDSRFANEIFATETLNTMYKFYRIPLLDVEFTTWLQPDIYPLDSIALDERKVFSSPMSLVVTDVSHKVSTLSGTLTQESTIKARYIDYSLFLPNWTPVDEAVIIGGGGTGGGVGGDTINPLPSHAPLS